MPIAIIIAFRYKEYTLNGSIIDIHRAKKYYEKRNIKVYTIGDSNVLPSNINRLIYQDVVDLSIFSLELDYVVHSINELLDTIVAIVKHEEDQKVALYYSGHGILNNTEGHAIVLPDTTILSTWKIRDAILSHLSISSQIFIVLDCCYPDNMGLRYIHQDDRFRMLNKGEWIAHNVIIITSSSKSEKSLALSVGSPFTKILFQELSCSNGNISQLISKIISHNTYHDYDINPVVYSTKPIPPVLWSWIHTDIQVCLEYLCLSVR